MTAASPTRTQDFPAESDAETRETRVPRRWLGLFAVLAAALLNLLDATIVNVAAPSIRSELGGSLSMLQWLAAGYTLAMAIGLLTGGRLGDKFGRRRMLYVGLIGFVLASVGCGLAPSIELLLVGRVLQGVTGALMVPQCFGLIRDLFGRESGKAFALFGPMVGLATVAGPIAAGLIVDADVFGTGWRMIFLINVPLGAFALAAGMRALPTGAPVEKGLRLDVRGSLLAGSAAALLFYPLIEGRELGWPGWVLWMSAASIPALGCFVLQQRRRARAGADPLIELSVFRKRTYSAGVVFVTVFFSAVVGFSMSAGYFLQLGLGYSPLHASVSMSAWAVGGFLGSAASGVLAARLGRAVLHLGLTVMGAGLIWLWFVLGEIEARSAALALSGPFAAFGVGMGLIFVPLFGLIVGNLDDHEVGSASGMLESFQQVGGTFGAAGLGTVFFLGFEAVDGVSGAAQAARDVTVATAALTAVAFATVFLLPKRARPEAS